MRACSARALAVGLIVFGFAACSKQPDPIGRDIQSVKDRSVPPGGGLIPTYGPRREGHMLRASWEVETDMAWDAYAAWIVAQLPEFRVWASDEDRLLLSRPLEGDVYTLALRPKATTKSLLVEVTFEAQPF